MASVVRIFVGLAVTASVVVAPTASTRSAPLSLPPISRDRAVRIIDATTVQLRSVACDLRRTEGTGVAVQPGRLLTNGHVVSRSRLIDVAADDFSTSVAGAPAVSAGADLATVDDPTLGPATVTLADRDPAKGAAVRVAGYPSGPDEPGLVIEDSRVIDYVDGRAYGQPGQVMRLAMTAEPGMSGGPVIDGAGYLAGIVFGDEISTGDALAIPASVIRTALQTPLVPSSCG